jgi:iron(III) transport system ATP-binding protein
MLQVTNLKKSFVGAGKEKVNAVRDLSFTVGEGEMFTLLGPSGCGKTTTLRCLAGLEHPTSGKIEIGGVTMFDGATSRVVAVNRRGLGMVFQSYAIWPHMSVRENVAFPLQVAPRKIRLGRARIRELVDEALEVMGMTGLAERSATQLSGGQQQRLALARAIVGRPKLLLFDEPLSNLDAKLRERMRFEIKRLQTELNISAVYVTHDQGEALALSDGIAVMKDGEIVQQGTPHEIYTDPNSDFVADFIGSANLVPGVVTAPAAARSEVAVQVTGGGIAVGISASALEEGGRVLLVVRPESVVLKPIGSSPTGAMRGRIRAKVYLGESTDLLVDCLGQELRVRVSSEGMPHQAGDEVEVRFAERSLVVRDETVGAEVPRDEVAGA